MCEHTGCTFGGMAPPANIEKEKCGNYNILVYFFLKMKR
jgi:hypothetical protein